MGKHDNEYISRFQKRERTLRARFALALIMLFITIPCLALGISWDSQWLLDFATALLLCSTSVFFISLFLYSFPLEES